MDELLRDEDLPRQHAALHALAMRLTHNSADADDVVQETWLAALQSPPGEGSKPRAWWMAVLRYRWARLRRREALRRWREREVAQQEARTSPGSDEDLGRISRAVRDLSEPYRSAVELRYVEGLSIRELTVRLGRTEPAVKSQLKRGLAMLRERLVQEPSERRSPLAGLMVLLGSWRRRELSRGERLSSLTAACAVGLVGGLLVVSELTRLREAPQPATLHARTSHERATTPTLSSPSSRVAPEFVAVSDRADETQPTRSARRAAGRVVDENDVPVAGASIWVRDDSASEELAAVSDPDGYFELDALDSRAAWLGATASDHLPAAWIQLEGPRFRQSDLAQVTLTLPTMRELVTGVVVDEDGREFGGARVRHVQPQQRALLARDGLWRCDAELPTAYTDARGAFAIPPDGAGFTAILVEAKDHAPKLVSLAPNAPRSVFVTLVRGERFEGRVVGPDGVGVRDAFVQWNPVQPYPSRETRTGDDGWFELDHLATRSGRLSARALVEGRALAARLETEADLGRGSIELRLGNARTVDGLATDGVGAPLQGWCVALCPAVRAPVTATPFGPVGLEGLRWTNTDAAGRFSIADVIDERGWLHLYPPGAKATSTPVASTALRWGALQRLSAEHDASRAEIAGSVLLRRSRAGLRVDLLLRSDALPFERSVEVSDERPTFRFDRLPAGHYELLMRAPGEVEAPLEELDLAHAERVLLAPRELPETGGVRVVLIDSNGAVRLPRRALLTSLRGAVSMVVEKVGTEGFRIELDGALVTPPLSPGPYRLTTYVQGFARVHRMLDVQPGEHLEIEIPLERGVRTRSRIEAPEELRPPDRLHTRVVELVSGDVGHATTLRDFVPRAHFRMTPVLAPGHYRFESWTDSGLRGAVEVVVLADIEPAEIVVTLAAPRVSRDRSLADEQGAVGDR